MVPCAAALRRILLFPPETLALCDLVAGRRFLVGVLLSGVPPLPLSRSFSFTPEGGMPPSICSMLEKPGAHMDADLVFLLRGISSPIVKLTLSRSRLSDATIDALIFAREEQSFHLRPLLSSSELSGKAPIIITIWVFTKKKLPLCWPLCCAIGLLFQKCISARLQPFVGQVSQAGFVVSAREAFRSFFIYRYYRWAFRTSPLRWKFRRLFLASELSKARPRRKSFADFLRKPDGASSNVEALSRFAELFSLDLQDVELFLCFF